MTEEKKRTRVPDETKEPHPYGTGTSATGSNAGPNPRSINEDAVAGTTSEMPPQTDQKEFDRRGKPERGSRFHPDT